MKKEDKFIFSTNSRIIKDLLTQYRNTFYAFCELVNNAIQAKATKIDITIDYAKSEVTKAPIKKIIIVDNGHGVSISDFDKKILEIGTDVKKGGEGVGRFAALQLGSQIEIETVAYDEKEKKHTKITLPINSSLFKNQKLIDLNFSGKKEILSTKPNSYYQVQIKSLHHNQNEKTDRKNLIAKELMSDNIRLSLFERYPYEIFNETIQFSVNKKKLKKSEFIYDQPIIKKEIFTDMKGDQHKMNFYFYKVKLNDNKAKVFFQMENHGLKSVATSFLYSSEWLSKDMGSWFIYVESPFFTQDVFRDIDMDELGDEGIGKLKSFTKDVVTQFFISINKEFETFTTKLKEAYPGYESENASSETQKVLFEQFAYIAEQKYKLIEKNIGVKEVLYPLMERAIADGNIIEILDSLLSSDKSTTDKFKKLLDVTDMESVVHFNSDVAKKIEFLDFLYELNYGKISEYILERSQLHKVVEKELWLFGESYNGSPNILWSDKKLLNIFEDLRKQYLGYSPTKEDENFIEVEGDGLNNITDLFFTNERPMDNGNREFMIVELKAPRCKISSKEISQIEKYAYAVESSASIPKHNTKYKLLLIAADITPQAKSKIKSASDAYHTPFLLERKKDFDIEIYLMTWSELINSQRAKLNYLSKHLKIKDKSVKQKFEEEYPNLINQKMRTMLKKIAN
ncbi:MAG: ATP-binding protein [Parachlamydiaceae bacterium]|nr:ATP-binding protein [Parachlamydiaceae bacterium]